MSAVLGSWGAALLTAPQRVVPATRRDRPVPRALVLRLLGARMVAQHALLAARPTRALVRAGVAVDLLHLASMVVLALVSPEHRRLATVSGATAAASAALEAAVAPVAER